MPQVSLQDVVSQRLNASQAEVAAFCQRWKIVEFALFGSVLRDDFRSGSSDVDILVTFASNHGWNLFDLMNMERELEEMFGRKVDITQKRGLRNPYSRAEILRSHQVIYASQHS